MNAPVRLPLRTKLLYSTGDLAVSVPLAILMFFQLYFLTDVARLPPDLAGTAIAVGRLWDAINDPLFGAFADRVRSRFGRRRVLLLFGAVPLGLSFAAMWWVPPLSPTGLAVYYACVYIVFDTAFTAVHVGHNALTPVLTHDYDERSRLNGWRMGFNVTGALGAIVFVTGLGWTGLDEATRFLWVGLVLGLVSIVPPLVVFATTRHVDVDAPVRSRDGLGVWQAIRTTVRNGPFVRVMLMYVLSWTAASLLSAVLVYVAKDYFGVPEQANYLVLTTQVCTIASIPLVVRLAARTDKRRAFLVGVSTWALVLLGISALSPDQLGLAYVLAGLSGFGIATTYVIPWAMIPDVVEYDQIRTGERREGSFYAFASFFQKLGTGAALWAMGQALAAVGYLPGEPGEVVAQPFEVLVTYRVLIGPVAATLLGLAMVVVWGYPLSRSRHRALLDELAT